MATNRDLAYQVHKYGDLDLLNRLRSVVKEDGISIQSATLALSGGGNIPLDEDLKPSDESPLVDLLSNHSLVVQRVILNPGIANWNVIVTRLDEPAVDQVSYRYQVPFEEGQEELLVRLQLAINNHVGRHAAMVSKAGSLPKAVREHIQAREVAVEQQLLALSTFSEQFAERLTESERRLLAQFEARRTELEARVRKQEEALDKRQEQLDDRSAELDAKDSQHARRQLRMDLKKELAQRATSFSLTEGTRQLRRPINVFTLVLLGVFGSGFVAFSIIAGILAFAPDSSWQAVSLASLRALAFGVGFGLTSIYYIRWQQNWFDKHAIEEFQQKRFDLDLDRASWLVETALDWRVQTDQPMSSLMMERLSEGLFSKEGKSEDVVHPSDQLASALLGASAEAELQIPGGSKLRLDRKGIKRLQDGESS